MARRTGLIFIGELPLAMLRKMWYSIFSQRTARIGIFDLTPKTKVPMEALPSMGTFVISGRPGG